MLKEAWEVAGAVLVSHVGEYLAIFERLPPSEKEALFASNVLQKMERDGIELRILFGWILAMIPDALSIEQKELRSAQAKAARKKATNLRKGASIKTSISPQSALADQALAAMFLAQSDPKLELTKDVIRALALKAARKHSISRRPHLAGIVELLNRAARLKGWPLQSNTKENLEKAQARTRGVPASFIPDIRITCPPCEDAPLKTS